jgi:hypothetical protein
MTERLPRLKTIDSDMWVDEAIWGHRLYDEQTPWLCFMEFLNVLQSEIENNSAFQELVPNELVYYPKQRLYLRNILFNNPQIDLILQRYPHDDKAAWSEWIEEMHKNQGGIVNANFNYLKDRFPSFEDFASVVKFLRQSTIEGENNKRWLSQFLFPYGPNCLYEDLNIKNNSVTNDRRFFARTGELLYLMVTRSGLGNETISFLKNQILNTDNKFNKIVTALEPKGQLQDKISRSGPYLPYALKNEYKEMVEDWIKLMRCNIPHYDVLHHVVNITGLHLIRYVLKRSIEVLDDKETLRFVLEVVSPKKTIVRDMSVDSYAENNNLSRQAVEKYVKMITLTEEWGEISDFADAVELLNKEFSWPNRKVNEVASLTTPAELIETLVQSAVSRHKQHLEKFHTTWGKEIGLVSRRGTRRFRYAPQDTLIKTLVFTVVENRMEYTEFLDVLYNKYGFIIGDKHINDGFGSTVDIEPFSENAKRLEHRLSSMGLLRRLSDACAYVENPFGVRA